MKDTFAGYSKDQILHLLYVGMREEMPGLTMREVLTESRNALQALTGAYYQKGFSEGAERPHIETLEELLASAEGED